MKIWKNRLPVTFVASVFAFVILTACGGGDTSSGTTIPSVPTTNNKPTEEAVEAEPTKSPERSAEEAATPAPEEKTDLIIDGHNITEFNKRDRTVAGFINNDLSYDEPRLVVALDNKDLNSQDIIAIISYGDHFVAPRDQNVVFYVYDVHEISSIDGDYVDGFAMSIDGSKKVSGFRLNNVGEEENQIDLHVYYSDDQYNEDIMKGTTYTLYVKKGDAAN